MHTPFANYIRLSVDLQCLSFSLYRAQGYDCQKLTLTRELQGRILHQRPITTKYMHANNLRVLG